MCKQCEAKAEILKVLEKYSMPKNAVDDIISYWICEDDLEWFDIEMEVPDES
jgi:hypothetical protein